MRLASLANGPYAVPMLEKLVDSQHDVALVVTRPPRGRQKQAPSPVHEVAVKRQLLTCAPASVNEPSDCERLRALGADLLVVCDYGEILTDQVLATTRLGGINLHGSLLPKYRGAAPVAWAILNGEKETGNTVIQMTTGLDAGPCLAVERIAIDPEETAAELEARMAATGAELVLRVVDDLEADRIQPITQDGSAVTRAPRLKKSDGQIDWSRSALEIKNQVRGLDPWPRAFCDWSRSGRPPLRMIVYRVALAGEGTTDPPGTVIEAEDRLVVATGDGRIEILEVQPAGKRKMTAQEFLRGYPLQPGEKLVRAHS